jgi:uncharacterized membrane protein YkvA (DUF1232 family)
VEEVLGLAGVLDDASVLALDVEVLLSPVDDELEEDEDEDEADPDPEPEPEPERLSVL